MSDHYSIDDLIRQIADFDHEDCMIQLRRLRNLRLDFTDDYLLNQSVDQLRHILLAACLQARKHSSRLAG